MKRSFKVNELLVDAEAAGHSIEEHGYYFDIRGPKRTSPGIALYVSETGAFHEAHRNDVNLELALGIRSLGAVRKVLHLEAK